ncbi:MAG: cysteate synthase [Odoribacteraceae bacterium]|jgi:cysteate synthase|nr:cysteate synthase [Odoribacteraceae bacterium]
MEILNEYHLESACCGAAFPDKHWELDCPHGDGPALLVTRYANRLFNPREELQGLYRYAAWLPVNRQLEGSAPPVTFLSENLGRHLGLKNLYITFSGYWPERGAMMQTGTFKECEAYAVCARPGRDENKILVVASAGNTARAFGRVCSDNNIPLLLCVPLDNIDALWADSPWNDNVKIACTATGSDYFDAIHLSNIACEMQQFYPEGGAKNVARRDGMATTVLSAVTRIGRIPDYYFQAIGSGTGAIAAWEANKRFIEDGRFGKHLMTLVLSQNHPFLPIRDAWKAKSTDMLPLDEQTARSLAAQIDARVLSNRKPPYAIKGGLRDALLATGGDILTVTNEEARRAADLFLLLEGIDIEPAAAVAVASLQQAANEGRVEREAIIMLNITGGGIARYRETRPVVQQQPHLTIATGTPTEEIKEQLRHLFPGHH